MSNRGNDMGDMGAINRKLNAKYDPESEAEVIEWISKMTGTTISQGRENLQNSLKNGQILVKLINRVYEGSTTLPPKAQKAKLPFKSNTMTAPFKQMENIQIFISAAENYGVPHTSLFQTVDLFEGRNLPQVLNTILQLGTESQRNDFKGPSCGPKPTYENRREFTTEQLRSGEGYIGLQAGTNKCASQSGMSMGGVRHIADIKVDEMSKESHGYIGLQSGTNKCASQAGMSMGGVRHVSDIKVEQMSKESQGIISLQAGSNQGASQAGMSRGGIRHISDMKIAPMSKEGESIIGLQAGSNKGASQAGMSMGGIRHISDIKVDALSASGASIIGLQMGHNQGASQAGMSFGAQRHITDSH